jgi:DNA-directed RNA polymerase specialized sigma24 family protein
LHWLAFLLTGNREASVDLALEAVASEDDVGPYFSTWMAAWSRRVVIAKALSAIRRELTASARRMESKRVPLPPRNWTLDRDTTKGELEDAVLAIDVFPRAALLLSIFEGVALEDAAVLLDAHPDRVRNARSAGLGELTSNLAAMRRRGTTPDKTSLVGGEAHYA